MEFLAKIIKMTYNDLPESEKERITKNFLEEHFDFDELKNIGFFDPSIMKEDYKKQVDVICKFFGYETIFQYGFLTLFAHITYENSRNNAPFVEEFKAWHED